MFPLLSSALQPLESQSSSIFEQGTVGDIKIGQMVSVFKELTFRGNDVPKQV